MARMNMNYQLIIDWNGTRVMDARCTKVMACDVLRFVFVGNFVGRSATMFANHDLPRLDDVSEMAIDQRISGEYSDETGRLEWAIIRL